MGAIGTFERLSSSLGLSLYGEVSGGVCTLGRSQHYGGYPGDCWHIQESLASLGATSIILSHNVVCIREFMCTTLPSSWDSDCGRPSLLQEVNNYHYTSSICNISAISKCSLFHIGQYFHVHS